MSGCAKQAATTSATPGSPAPPAQPVPEVPGVARGITIDAEDQALLQQARDRVEKLLADLLDHLAEIENLHGSLAASCVEVGRAALKRSVDAARQLLQSIDAAIEIGRQNLR